MRRKAPTLPDLDDDEFTRRLKPLEAMMQPTSKGTANRNSDNPEERKTGTPEDGDPGYSMNRTEAVLTPKAPDFANGTSQPGGARNAGYPEDRNTGHPGARTLGFEDVKNTKGSRGSAAGSSGAQPYTRIGGTSPSRPESSGIPRGRWIGAIGAAERLVHIEHIRGPKRRFEYLMPQRVGDALAKDAVSKGKSATLLLLEVLRDAGYPVIPEDLIDLRKERRR